MNDIKDKPELTALVDELYFEYHFWFDDLDFGWGSQRGGKYYVEDSVGRGGGKRDVLVGAQMEKHGSVYGYVAKRWGLRRCAGRES